MSLYDDEDDYEEPQGDDDDSGCGCCNCDADLCEDCGLCHECDVDDLENQWCDGDPRHIENIPIWLRVSEGL